VYALKIAPPGDVQDDHRPLVFGKLEKVGGETG
jgi:hypothetical protein